MMSAMPKTKMTPEQFCYWLHGYMEINQANGKAVPVTAQQWECIQDHLAEVFKKQTPTYTQTGTTTLTPSVLGGAQTFIC